MRRRVWLVRISLFGLVAAVGSLPYGCGSTSKTGGAPAGDAGAGGERDSVGGGAAVGGAPGDGAIEPCTSDKVCRDSGRLCDTERSICVICRGDADCGGQQLCVRSECVDYTPCENSRQCPTDQVCDETAGVCVQCVGDADCPDEGICVAAQCHAPCASDKSCVSSGQLCDEANGYCVDCSKDSDCGSDAYCNVGVCQPGVCEPGDALCLGTSLLSCDASGSGYASRECAEGCSETDGAHCVGEQGAGGSGGVSGLGGEGGLAGQCGDTDSDPTNCGACGYSCVHGRECVSGRCTPAWQPLTSDNAPSARTRHAAGFVAGQFVVLGGSATTSGLGLSSTAAYDVVADAWSSLAPLNSARCSHEAVSTGTDILTFGGLTDCSNGGTTGPALERFTPNDSNGAWSLINAAGAPGARYNFAATWTGDSLFVYGGGTNAAPAVATGALFSGATWSDAGCPLQNCERGGVYSAFTDGDVVHIWGGGPYGNAPAGLSYDLTDEVWAAWQVPTSTAQHLAQRFADDGRRIYFLNASNVVTIYDRLSSSWLPNDTAAMPPGFCTEAATAWTGDEVVAWSGECGNGPVDVGGRYQPPAPN